MSLKTILDLPALIRGEWTTGSEFKSRLAPATPPRPARCPLPRCPVPAQGGPADPITCSVRPPSAGKGERRRAGLGAEAVSCSGRNLCASTGCKCPGSRRERGAGGIIAPLRDTGEPGQEGSSHPCGCRRSQAPPKLLNVPFIKAFRGLFFGVCLQTHKGRAAVWGSFLMEKGLGDPRHKRNPGSAFNGQDSMRGTLRGAGGGEGPPGAA